MTYIYNITFHCAGAISPHVLTYLQAELIPAWRRYGTVANPRLMQVHANQEGIAAYCIHWSLTGTDASQMPDETKDPYVLRLMQRYPEMVMAFGVLLEPIDLD